MNRTGNINYYKILTFERQCCLGISYEFKLANYNFCKHQTNIIIILYNELSIYYSFNNNISVELYWIIQSYMVSY